MVPHSIEVHMVVHSAKPVTKHIQARTHACIAQVKRMMADMAQEMAQHGASNGGGLPGSNGVSEVWKRLRNVLSYK